MQTQDQLLKTASQTLLAPYALEASQLQQVFGAIMTHDVDYADLYFQYLRTEAWSLEEGIVKSGSFNIDQGVGVRAVAGEKTAFAYSDEISLAALKDAAGATRAIARLGGRNNLPVARAGERRKLYPALDPLASLVDTDKVRCSSGSSASAAALDPRVVQVMASLAGEYEVDAGRARRRRDGRRRAAARAAVGAGDRRAERPPRAGRERRRRAVRLRLLHRRGARGLRGEGGGPGARQPRRAAGAGRHDDRRARPRLAGRAAARGDRARARRRFQPQGHVRLHRPHRRARRRAGRHGGRRRHAAVAPRLAQRRRRGQPDAAHDADRGRRAARLHAGQPERAADEGAADRQRPARDRTSTSRCRA